MVFHLASTLFPFKDIMQNSLEANIITAINKVKSFHEPKYLNDQRQRLQSCSGNFNKIEKKYVEDGYRISFFFAVI